MSGRAGVYVVANAIGVVIQRAVVPERRGAAVQQCLGDMKDKTK